MKAAVVGASGYTGGELLKILGQHPEVDEIVATSREHAGKDVAALHSDLKLKLKFSKLDLADANSSDVVFLCVPHTKSMELVPKLETKIVDLSADFRLKDAGVYEKFYKVKHSHPKLLKDAVYGLPELHRKEIKKARLVANPGCYATNIILALHPLAAELAPGDVAVSSFSGYSGAGRKKVESKDFFDLEENIIPYNVTGHRHTAELAQELGAQVSFVPHVVNVWRGMLSTIILKTDLGAREALKLFKEVYAEEAFIKIKQEVPQMLDAQNTNDCIIGGFAADAGQLVFFSATDNLTKGASGQAVQNMNIMFGFEETTGLKQ